ncbi:PAS domain S-box protein [Myxosarcina sp. GI1]|uniref:PAS domain S-box protein n=1 Tax=Myxosarcina sp. GI1 TaxID=1541065 RepID=UPI00055E5956|nr:PAS domain S-box protein [Myxosarcina sp. GI1]
MLKQISPLLISQEHGFCIIEMLFDRQQQPIDYRFVAVNRAFEKQTGLKQALGKRMLELVPNHDKHWFEIYGRVALTSEAIHFEHFASALNRWYRVYAYPVERIESQHNNVAIFFQEIKELKPLATLSNNRTNDVAIASEEFDGSYKTDFEGKFIFVAPKLCEKLGYSQSELLGKTFAEIMYPEDVAKNIDLLKRMASNSLPYRLKQHLLRKNGSPLAVKLVAYPIYNVANTVEFARTVITCDSEVQKLQSRMQQSERRLALLAEIVRDVFWILDPKSSQILYVSPSYERVWGRSRQEIYRNYTNWLETVYPGDRQRIIETTASFDYQEDAEIKYRIVRPDGSIRWISDRGFAIRDSQGQIDQIIGIARDITAEKQTKWQLERNNQFFKFLSDSAINLVKHPDSEAYLSNLLNRLVSLLQLKCYYFCAIAEDKIHLQLKLSYGIDTVTRQKIESVNLNDSVCGIALVSEGRLEIANVQNIANSKFDLLHSLGITAHACYAVIVEDKVVGTLSFSRDTGNSFDAEETTLLRTVSDLVAIALMPKS